ncbi:MAG: alpha/beta hydrolase [Paludibacter sp.]
MKRLSVLFTTLLVCLFVFSKSQVDTISIYCPIMQKEIKSVVVLPDSYNKKSNYPVVYLLHGYSDNYAKWINTVPSIKTLANEYQLILVCPDGGYSSWYFDSPIDSTFQYETFITRDLLPYIDQHYSTIADRSARAITGLSMGGHGALYLAIRNRDLFASAGSMSGGVDLRTSTKKFDIAKRIGSIETNAAEWDNRSVVNMVSDLKNKELNLIIDCGVSDFFYQINADLHRRLVALNIDHDYIERPGSHNWDYWTNSIQYQLLYFDRCFHRTKSK